MKNSFDQGKIKAFESNSKVFVTQKSRTNNKIFMSLRIGKDSISLSENKLSITYVAHNESSKP